MLETKKSETENNLSPTERRFCKLRAAGLTNKEIGELVGKAEKTIRNAFWQIRSKLAIPDKDMSLIRNASGINDLQLDTKRTL